MAERDAMEAAPLVYLILGPTGAGRRAVLIDLMANGLLPAARPLLLVSGRELPLDAATEARMSELTGLTRAEWTKDERGQFVTGVPEGITHVFVLADGRVNPVDQVEAFHGWLMRGGMVLGRIITVVDCALGHAHPELQRWFDACVHFSDVVLLNHRAGVPNAWISEFTTRLRKQHLPCLVEMVKKDEVENPALVLEPQARRLSTMFDSPADWPDLDEEDDDFDGEDPDTIGATDSYLERLPSGRRARELPDIARFLGP